MSIINMDEAQEAIDYDSDETHISDSANLEPVEERFLGKSN